MGSRVLLPSTGAWEEVQEVLNEQKAIGRHCSQPQTSAFFHGAAEQEGMRNNAQCLPHGRQSINNCKMMYEAKPT